MNEASSAWDERNVDLTKEICYKIIKCDNSIIPAHLFLMWCYFVSGQTLKAELEADFIIIQDNNDIDALEVTGRIAFIRGDNDTAITAFKRIIKTNPESAVGYYWLGIVFQKQRNYKESLIQLKKAFVLKPANVNIISALHDTYALSNDQSGILNLSDKLIQSDKHQLKSLGFGYKARLSVKKNNYTQAVEEYRLAVKNSPRKISYYLLLARQLIKINKLSEAEKILQDALSIDSVNRYALLEMALLKYKQNDLKASIECYKEILELYPNWAIAVVNLSDVLAKQNPKSAEALSYALQAKKAHPKLWITRLNLGKIFLTNKNTRMQKKSLLKLLNLTRKAVG